MDRKESEQDPRMTLLACEIGYLLLPSAKKPVWNLSFNFIALKITYLSSVHDGYFSNLFKTF